MENKAPALFDKPVVSIRLTDDDRALITENFDLIADGEELTSARRFLVKAVEKAISRKTTVKVTEPDPAQAQEISRLTQELKEAGEAIADLATGGGPNPQAEAALKTLEEIHGYFWPFLEIAKRDGRAVNYAELFKQMLARLNKDGLWIPDEADRAYINSLKEQL
jgi:hypothetical protein